MQNRNYAYDGFRVIFIILMILHHFDMFYNVNISSFSDNLKKIYFEGFVGVNFFFMLSGIGCAMGYSTRLSKGEVTINDFLKKRIFRLYPTYFMFLLTAAFLYGTTYKLFLLNLFGLQSWSLQNTTAFTGNAVSWCISVNSFFYIFFCFTYNIDLKKSIYLTILLFTIILINMLFAYGDFPTSIFYTNPLFRLLEFSVGMNIALYINAYKPKRNALLQIFSIATLMIAIIYGAYGNVPLPWRWSLYYLIPIAFLLYSFSEETLVSKRLFDYKIVSWLSKTTLVVYLSHQQILYMFKKILPNYIYFVSEHFYIFSILAILTVFLCSGILNYFYTSPITKLLLNKTTITKKEEKNDNKL